MTEKSFVTIEQKICVICGKQYDTDSLLLDTRMHDRFEWKTCTGFGSPCEECKGLLEGKDGQVRIALIGIDPTRSGSGGYALRGNEPRVKSGEAHRSGRISFLDQRVWDQVFDQPIPEGNIVFLDDKGIDMVEARVAKLVVFINARNEFADVLPKNADREVEIKKFCASYVDPGEDEKIDSIGDKRKEEI